MTRWPSELSLVLYSTIVLLFRTIHRYKPGLKKGEGGSSPARQAGEFGIVCPRQGGGKGNKQIKVERLSFGKI